MDSRTLLPVAALLLASPTLAQGSDDCATPTAINALGTYAYDTTAATTSGFDGGGTCAAGASSVNQDLFWVFTAPTSGDFQFDTDGSSYDTKLSIHSGSSCSATCLDYDDDGGAGLQSLIRFPGVTAGDQILVQVGGFGTGNGSGVLNISQYIDFCAGTLDDMLEENDTCAAAAPILPGTYNNLVTRTTDLDFYRITLQPGELYDIDAVGTTGAVDIRIYDDACNILQNGGDGTTSWSNLFSTGPVDFIIEVAPDINSATGCAEYSLALVPSTSDCFGVADDMLEQNDFCGQAVTLGDGLYTGLSVFDVDNDFFAIGLDDGATLTADIFFTDSVADVDIYLWDPNVGCGTTAEGTGGPYLVRGFSASDDEQITYTNTSGAAQGLIVEIDMFTEKGCNTYDLQLAGTNGMGTGFGTNYCMPNPNSTGATGQLSGAGSLAVSDNDVTLTASSLPTFGFGFFIVSQTQGFAANPGGSSGNICVGGSVGRYVGPGQVQNSGAAGEISLALDLAAIPQPNGFVSVVAGDTWNFQLWHRDSTPAGQPTSNFTNGLEVIFQ